MKKLILVGSDSIHTSGFHQLVSGYFDQSLFLGSRPIWQHEKNSKVILFSAIQPFLFFKGISEMKKFLRKENPSIIHILQVNSYAYGVVRAANSLKIPVVLTALGSDILLTPQRNFFWKKLIQYTLKHSNALTADSTIVAEKMKSLCRGDSCEVLVANFGISTGLYSGEKENIIYSNRLHRALYRVNEIIGAFLEFISLPEYSNWKLVVAGEAEETPHLKELAGGSLNIIFPGWADNTLNESYYKRAKIFVSYPKSDATSISLLEAMACGCIPVVSDLPANREWIEDGLNGIITSKLTAKDFIRAVQLDRNKLVEQNHQLIQSHGTREINRRKFFSVYDKILSQSK